MNKNRFHLSDEELLLAADGELSERRLGQIRAHLGACWACRTRMATIEGTIGDVVRLTRESLGPELPPIDRARAQLKVRLAEMARTSSPRPLRRWSFAPSAQVLAYAAGLVLLLALGARFLYHGVRAHEGDVSANTYAAALPNPALTPGATQSVSLASICSSEHDQVIRRVSASLRQQVFREYGIAGAPASDYEIDHLVTPGLGGSDDIRNLWPEPRYRTVWNSYVKDQLEDHLHHLVCNGQVSLAVAQHDISSDWISAYRKYFQTDVPLLPYATSVPPNFIIARNAAVDRGDSWRPFRFARSSGPGPNRAAHPLAPPEPSASGWNFAIFVQ